ncbi:unnamed protein product, partial [Nesidiocoris tenuis]
MLAIGSNRKRHSRVTEPRIKWNKREIFIRVRRFVRGSWAIALNTVLPIANMTRFRSQHKQSTDEFYCNALKIQTTI